MKRSVINKCLIVMMVASGCSGATTTQKNVPAVNAVSSSAVKAVSSPALKSDQNRAALEQQLARIAAEAHGRVGVAARVIETGEEASLNAGDHFPMQSVYKLPISMAVLRRVDAGELKLDQMVPVTKSDFVRQGQQSPIRDKNPNGTQLTIAELLRYTIGESDGTGSDVLLNLVGGGPAVMKFLREIDVSGLNVLNSEKEIGRDWQTQYENWATPSAAVDLLVALHAQRGLSAQSQQLVLKLMIESTPGAMRLKGQLPAGTVVAHKTGTGGTRDGVTSATNDIGIITLPNGQHLAVAVFVSDSKANLPTRERVIAKIAKALWDEWAR